MTDEWEGRSFLSSNTVLEKSTPGLHRGGASRNLAFTFLCAEFRTQGNTARAGVVQWQNGSFPSCIRGFDSLRPLQYTARIGPMVLGSVYWFTPFCSH